jgi:hypothetical protein
MKDIKYYADLAGKILKGTAYETGKRFIRQCFESDQQNQYADRIMIRLSIIDAYYSTNMSRRLYGIEEIVKGITEISKKDSDLKDILLEYITSNSGSKKLINLFEGKYGIHKDGDSAGRATSLISKYAYFLTDYQFPIYDYLARKMYPKIAKKHFKGLVETQEKDATDFFRNIKKLNEISGINNFDQLDKLLWLAGKIDNGTIALLLNKDDYKKIGAKNDEEMRVYLKESVSKTSQDSVFNDRQLEFMRFVFDLAG